MASGANAAFRELGGVFGIAVLGAIFSAKGGYSSGQSYVNGLVPAIAVGAAVVVLGAVAAALVPGRRRARAASSAMAPAARAEGTELAVVEPGEPCPEAAGVVA